MQICNCRTERLDSDWSSQSSIAHFPADSYRIPQAQLPYPAAENNESA